MSNITEEASVVLKTSPEEFPTKSWIPVIFKESMPSVSPEIKVYEAVHTKGPPEILAELPFIVAVGLWILSSDVNVTVTEFPSIYIVTDNNITEIRKDQFSKESLKDLLV